MTKTQTTQNQEPQFVTWQKEKKSKAIRGQWNSYNIAQMRAGKPAVMLPTNLSLEELEVAMQKLLKQLTAK